MSKLNNQQLAKTVNKMQEKIYTLKDVIKVTSMSKSTIYRLISMNEFPASFKLSLRKVAWLESDIVSFIQQRRNNQS